MSSINLEGALAVTTRTYTVIIDQAGRVQDILDGDQAIDFKQYAAKCALPITIETRRETIEIISRKRIEL